MKRYQRKIKSGECVVNWKEVLNVNGISIPLLSNKDSEQVDFSKCENQGWRAEGNPVYAYNGLIFAVEQ